MSEMGMQAEAPFIAAQRRLALAGPAVATLACQFDVARYSDHRFAQHCIALPAGAARWVHKRRAEYLAGRIAAQGAQAMLGLAPAGVAADADRAPRWPAGVVGSITHSDRHAVCSVARREQVDALGIDLENMISAQVAADIMDNILSSGEQALLRTLPTPFEQALTIAFSAKESLYKALYPDVRAFFDFDAAELCALDTQARTFVLRLTCTLSARWTSGTLLAGRYLLEPGTVLTQIAVLREDDARSADSRATQAPLPAY